MAEPSIEEILKAIEKASKDNPTAFKRLQTALQVKADEGVAKVRTGSLEDIQKEIELEMERTRILKENAQVMNRISDFKKEEAKEAQLALELEIQKKLNSDEVLEDAKEDYELLLARVKSGKELGEDLSHIADLLENSIVKSYKEIVPDQTEINELSRDTARNIEDQVNAMGSLVGLTNKLNTSKIGKMNKMMKTLTGKEGTAAKKELSRQLSEMFSLQNIAMNIFDGIFNQSMKVLKSFDDATANLAKTTGTVGKFNDVLYDAQRAGNLLGVTMENVGSAIAALNAGTSEFAKLNKQTQTQLAIATSQFEKLGVSGQDTAAFMENAFKIMNMGATEAIKVQKELAMAGVDLGIGADKIVKDFNAASKTLAVYGKDSVRIFKDLAAQAKAAGVEVSTLLGIVQKFDTFSGAAEGAAHFNALLGTQLSTTEMLMMTEDERMKTLVEQVQAQGVAFGDMDRYTQKAIAAAAGISDMNEANRIFSMSLADYEANAAQMEENAAAQAKFDEAVQATVPTMNKFKNLATEMIVMVQPALEFLGELADDLTNFFQGLSKETKEVVGTFALFTAGILTIAPLFAVGGGLMAGLAAVGPAIAGIGTGIATAVAAISGVTMTGVGAAVLGTLIAAGGGIAATMAAIAASKADIAESNAEMMSQGSETIQSMAEIGRADFSGIAVKFKGVVDELNSMSTDVKVTSMMQNLSLISAGTAIDITGAKIQGSSTNISTTVKNMFEGATISLKAGGREFEAYFEELAANVVVSNSKQV
jgi:hypothetical protein